MATQSTVVGIHKPGIESELPYLFEAREAVEEILATLHAERERAETELVAALARDIAGGALGPDTIAERIRAWRADDQQRSERIEAVQLALEKIKCRIDELKVRYRAEAAQWLERQIASLLREESAQQKETRVTAAKVKALQDELEALRGKPGRPTQEAGRGAEAQGQGVGASGSRRSDAR